MKKALQLLFLCFLAVPSFAQTCMPDTTVVDTTGGLGVIFPLPYDETTMTGGLEITACQGSYYEQIFTAKIPESIDFNGFPLGIDYMQINEDGVLNLPDGLEYVCNPPDCIFNGGEFGCVLVYGETNDAVGDYDIKLNIFISSSIIQEDFIEPGILFPGEYILKVEETGSPDCFVVGTSNLLSENLAMSNTPNPFGGYTQINITSGINQEVQFQIHDLVGKQIHNETINIVEGENIIEFDGSTLPEGMYTYGIQKGTEVLTKKMIINR